MFRIALDETKYSRVDRVKFVEDSLLKNFTWSIPEYFVPDVSIVTFAGEL